MLVQVTTDNHIKGRQELTGEIEASVAASLSRFADQITRVTVHLADENAKKTGDDDKQCSIEVRFAGLPPFAATGNGSSLDQAVDSALDKLNNQLDHKLGRLSDRKGRVSFGGEPAQPD